MATRKIAIVNTTLVMRDHFIPDGVLLIEGGAIAGLGEARHTPVPKDYEVIDAEGAYAGPGLIDIHTHSGDGKYFFEDTKRAAAHHLRHGITSLMGALYYNLSRAEYLDAIDEMKNSGAPNLIGIYMEGPYLNPKFGCDRERNHWRGPINRADYLEIIERAGDFARVWSVAPEREGIEDFVRDVAAMRPGIVFSVAHSEASPEQIEALMPYGLKLGTHHTNATGDLPKYPECRGVCVDETVNYNREIYAELICDSRGIHVAPYMLRLVRKIKGEDRIILISDACEFDGPVPPGYEGVTDINFDYSGEIAGSKLTLERACRNMTVHTGCSVADAFRYASYNPSRLLGLTDRGELRRGLRADIALVDHMFNIKKVILNGEVL